MYECYWIDDSDSMYMSLTDETLFVPDKQLDTSLHDKELFKIRVYKPHSQLS